LRSRFDETYNWFSIGLNIADLEDAEALLDEFSEWGRV
jgi:hypothetical protein